eukprot:gene15101-16660_t
MVVHYTDVITCIILIPLILLSIIGNILIMTVKLYRRKLKSFNSGDLFIVNLAICDINKTWTVFLLWSYHQVMYNSWQFNDLACSGLHKLVLILFSVSSLTLLVLTTERFLLIVKPFNRSFTFKRATVLLAVIWLTSITLATPPLFLKFKVYDFNSKLLCTSEKLTTVEFSFKIIYYVIIIFIPFALIIALSRSAALVLTKNSCTAKTPQLKRCPVFNGKMRRNKSAIYILKSISLGYSICYVPLAVIYILDSAVGPKFSAQMDDTLFEPVLTWCVFSSFCNTPLTYVIFSQEFRKELKAIFQRKKAWNTKRTAPLTQITAKNK